MMPLLPIDAIKAASADVDEPQTPQHPCPCCGGRMIIIETSSVAARPDSPAADTCNQDRYLMTSAPKPRPPQSRSPYSLVQNRPRWHSAEHDINAASQSPIFDRRSNYPPRIEIAPVCKSPQLAPSFALLAPRLVDRSRSNPHGARGTAPSLPRFPPLEVFVRRPRSAWRRRHGAGIRKPSH